MRQFAIASLSVLAWLPSCHSTYHGSLTGRGHQGVLIAESEDEDSTRRRWLVYPGVRHEPRIDVTASKMRTVPRIGVTVSAVTRKRGESEGVKPWRGVWVDKVHRKFPAARAGITRGDIILTVAGEPVSSAEQLSDLISVHGVPGQELEITMHARRRGGDPIEGRSPIALSIVPDGVDVRDTNTDSIPLEASIGVQTYTGLQAVNVPQDVSRTIYDVDHPVVLVTGVVSGSPAYYAGLRSGDRVLSCDGSPIESLDDIRDAVAHRLLGDHPTVPLFDLPASTTSRRNSSGQDIAFEVTGPLGSYTTDVPVEVGIEDSSRFHIPIVTDYRSRVNGSRLSFLNFIFQFGFNYRSRTLYSTTREPVETSRFSMLPFGMFEVEHGRNHSEYTLFWFITFKMDR